MRRPGEIGNDYGYTCPKCAEGHDLRVSSTIWATLTVNGADVTDSDTEWGDESSAYCRNCKWAGKVGDLNQEEVRQ